MANGRQTPAAAGQSSQDVVVSQNSASLMDVLDPGTDASASASIISAPPVTPPCTPEPVAAPPHAPDPFDPAALRLSPDFTGGVGVKKVLTTLPCRKPNRHEFVRVRPGEDWRLETGVFEDKLTRDVYLVQRELWAEWAGEVSPVCLFLATNRQGDVFVWPTKLPAADGRSNAWNESALAAALLAESKWVRVASNTVAGMYDVYEAEGELSEPAWPDLSFPEVLRLCFRDRFIQSVDHPALQALRGLA